MSVEVRYHSDPACTWSWAAEPALRRLLWEFEGELDFVWAMGGLARHLGSAYRDSEAAIGTGSDCFAGLMSHWLNVAGRTGMPCTLDYGPRRRFPAPSRRRSIRPVAGPRVDRHPLGAP